MKTITQTKHLLVLSAALAVTLSACSSVNSDVATTLSNEEIELATEIVAVSLADDESGIISSMYDAFSTVDESGISYDKRDGLYKKGDNNPRRGGNSGRGGEQNFEHSYDSTTGVHTLSYTRSIENEMFSKSVSSIQEVIYTDLAGSFVANPKIDKETIEAISFSSSKTGESEGPFRSSSFTKNDAFKIEGVHSTSSTLSMNGTHFGVGEASGTMRDSTTKSRSYEINISFENIAIVKDTVSTYGNLEQGVSGTLTYSILMNNTTNGVPEETLVEGTIDLEDDGTALLRFNKLPNVIRLSLVNGERDNQSGRR